MPYIFNTTVMENVRVGKADASDEEVYEACRNAMIHDTIMARPHGYRTQIGEQGWLVVFSDCEPASGIFFC